jgi:DNA-binding response OmpR family regulator
MARILVVDDDIRMARMVETYLRSKNHQVTICTAALNVLDVIAKEQPDLMILDIAMPGVTGLELCRRLRAQPYEVHLPILFLSARGTTDDKIAGLEAGADDYLAKPFDLRELELRVEALLRRARPKGGQEEPDELRVGNLRLDKRTFKAYVDDREVQLTPVEYELLRYLMMRAGRVVSAEELLQDVWRYYPGTGDTAVVRVQIMNLRNKIERDRKAPEYIQTVYRHGYIVNA